MIDSRYALLTTIVLGVAHMCMFVGFDTGSLIVESVLHSVHDRRPEEMAGDAGYYSQAIMNSFNMVGHIVAPAVLCMINAKWSMMIGSISYFLSFASYILMNEYGIYAASGILGLLSAVFSAGYYRYLTQIATVDTIEKVNGVEWSICNLSMLFGGILYVIVTILFPNSGDSSLYRDYSDIQIQLIYGGFTVFGILATLIFCFLSNREVADSISSSAKQMDQKGGTAAKIGTSLLLTLKSFFDPLVLQLTPHFIYVGWQNTVWISIYPTTLQFTEGLSQNIFATAFYGMAFSLGSLTMGMVTAPLSRKIKLFGQTPCLILAACLQLLSGVLILLATPDLATIGPTDEASLLIPPNVPLALTIGFLFGLLDGCNNTNRTVMCATAVPGKRDQLFAIARFYQALSASVLLFCSSFLTIYWMLAIGSALFVVAAFFYVRVSSLMRKNHLQPHNDSKAEIQSTTTTSDCKEKDHNISDFETKFVYRYG